MKGSCVTFSNLEFSSLALAVYEDKEHGVLYKHGVISRKSHPTKVMEQMYTKDLTAFIHAKLSTNISAQVKVYNMFGDLSNISK